ncbi:nickel insertion protein, partial [Priestia megaterium]|uniref:nickel insertion protein n=1 Tax=Priestia megaterium TaxID=1404 RepID=UPI002FFF474E
MVLQFSSHNEHIDNEMIKMEVNLDDIPGEWLGYVMDLLFEAGANDVFYTP